MFAMCRWTVCTLSTSCSAISASVSRVPPAAAPRPPARSGGRPAGVRSRQACSAPGRRGTARRRRDGVAVAAPGEVLVAGQLHEGRSGDALGEVAAEGERDRPVARGDAAPAWAADVRRARARVEVVDGRRRTGGHLAGADRRWKLANAARSRPLAPGRNTSASTREPRPQWRSTRSIIVSRAAGEAMSEPRA